MLQIILFILKLIGWILLLILGLLVLLFLVALFTPLRYQVETSCRGKLSTLEAGVNFRIFFRLVSGSLRYRDGNLSWDFRAAWIRLGNKAEAENVEEKIEENIKEEFGDLEEVEEKKPESTAIQPKDSEGGKPEIRKEELEDVEETKESIVEGSGDSKTPGDIEDEKTEKDPESLEAAGEKKIKRTSETLSDTIEEKHVDNKEKMKVKEASNDSEASEDKQKESLTDKIASVFKKIKYTFEQMCAKIRMLLKKAESVKAFLTDEVHQSAFLKCIAELKKMVIRMRPKQIAGEVHFGFEDPSLTGRVLAGISMLYPYWGDHICCHPDFDNKILEGEVSVKGSLRLLPAAVCMWNLLWNKNVRRTIMDVKRFIFK